MRLSYKTFCLLSTFIVILAGATALCWQVVQRQSTRADGVSVVGPPSLPAATVDAILTRMGSPMAGTGKVVEQASRRTQIDDAFALGVWWVETNSGAAGVGRTDRNPGSVRGSPGYPSGYGGYTIYPSYAAAIVDWFDILKSRYINRGLTSVYTICYPYVGTSSAPLWAAKVARLMWLYRGEAPPPAPKPKVPQHQPLMPILFKPFPTWSISQELRKPVDNAQIIAPPSMLTGGNRLFIISLGLLVALLIALGGALIRRSAPMMSLSSESQSEPVTPLPALIVNQFSPVLEQWDSAGSPLLQAVAQTVSTYSAQHAEPVSEAGLPEQISHSRERFSRRVMLVPSRAEAERAPAVDTGDEVFSGEPFESSEPVYSFAPSLPGLSLRGRVPVSVGAGASSGGSLLARYSNRA
jgi:hypothetical protein